MAYTAGCCNPEAGSPRYSIISIRRLAVQYYAMRQHTPSAMPPFLSTRFYGLQILDVRAHPRLRIKAADDAGAEGGVRPFGRRRDVTVLGRIEVQVIHVCRVVGVLENSVFPKPALPPGVRKQR